MRAQLSSSWYQNKPINSEVQINKYSKQINNKVKVAIDTWIKANEATLITNKLQNHKKSKKILIT